MSEKDKELIMKARPNLKPNTIKMYIFNLNKLKKLFNEDNLKFLSNVGEVKDKIKDLHYTTQRNFYNAIIVYLRAGEKNEELIEKYDTMRNAHNEQYRTDNESGKISEKQKVNFVEKSELEGMITTMDNEIKSKKLKKKETLSPSEMTLLQVYVIFSVLISIPLRNDLSGMKAITRTEYNKLSADDKKTDNYLVVDRTKLTFILNEYKTSRKYKQKDIAIAKDLEKILRMYIRKNGMGVLFKTSTGATITRNGLSQLLIKTSKKYLNKSISTTMIRKIVLSDMFVDTKKEMEKMSEITGHSVATMNNVYVKEGQS
tara:strand:- start:20250 stop:21194 length:945 start_codon:yes stop_codon:yes gene_type:complete